MYEKTKKTLCIPTLPSDLYDKKGGNHAEIYDIKDDIEMKVVRYGIGFDVHKPTIVVCVQAQLQDATTIEIKVLTFKNTKKGLTELCAFLKQYKPVSHYIMECTGVYHLPLVHKLRNAFPEDVEKIMPMNPLMIHWRITDLGVKHDKADARDIALLSFYDGLLKPSYVGSIEFFNARDTMRTYSKVQTQLTRLKNRMTRRLDSINQKFPFDYGKEWCLELLDTYFSQKSSLEDAFNMIIDRKNKKGISTTVLEKHRHELREYGEISLPDKLRFLLKLDFARFLNEDVAASLLLKEAEKNILNDPELKLHYIRLLDVPGIGASTALIVILELGDFRRFSKWQSLVKFCGVVPTISSSGDYNSKGHINKFTNKYLRRALSQAASSIVNRCDRSHDLGAFAYKQAKIRNLPYKKSLMKVAQKLARVIYSILIDGIEYDKNYENKNRMRIKRMRRLKKHNTMLETRKVRALKRNIQDFLISNYEYMNSTSRYHLISGCERMIRKARYLEHDQNGHEHL